MVNRTKNHIALASDAYRLGLFDETARHLSRHVQLQARDHEAWHFLGMVEFQRGKLDKALAALKRAVFLKPDFAEAHCNRGNVLRQSGALDEALQSYERAISSNSFLALAHSNRGAVLAQLGRHAEALGAFERAIRIDPHDAESWFGRGNSLADSAQHQDAIDAFDKALSLKPDFAEAYANRGIARQALGHNDQALEDFDRALRAKPAYARAHFNRGVVLASQDRLADALLAYDAALALDGLQAEPFTNRGNVLKDLGRLDDALASHERALQLRPDYAEAHSNRGTVLEDMQRHDDALAAYASALQYDPNHARAFFNRGVLQQARHDYHAAVADYDRAIALYPDFADAHLNRAHIDLLLGRLAQGWRGYEWRDERRTLLSLRPEPVLSSLADLSGKRIFVRWEQGLGDTILFCRYLPLLASAGACVAFAPQKQVSALMGFLSGDIRLVEDDAPPGDFDACALLMSLPRIFGTEISSVPATAPYLSADPARVKAWRDRIGPRGFRIGICWQGNSKYKHDALRSFPLASFEPLARLEGVRLISLQKGDGASQMASLPTGMTVETLGEDFDSGPDAFLDTAAAMQSLDLIVTSDTAVAHLAGALGLDVWLVLGRVPEWRWLLDGDASPWYPTMRLFRQTKDGDWQHVFEAIANAVVQRLSTEAGTPRQI